jgi:hypothetical protein
MGSQIFDYWFDPSKFILEHYVDGDLVNSSYKTNRSLAAPGNLHVWGKYLSRWKSFIAVLLTRFKVPMSRLGFWNNTTAAR